MSRYFILAAICSLAGPASAQESASWLRTRALANALNPRISALGHVVAQSGPSRADTNVTLREVELGFQSEIDPFGRADFFIAKPHDEAVEVEEGYFTLTSLPAGVLARGGKFLANFGKLNMTHHLERPGVTSPLVLDKFMGPEGLVGVGAEASRVFVPFGAFTEVSYTLLQDLGELAEKDPVTTTVVDSGGNTVTVRVHEDEPTPSRKFRDFAHLGRVRTYKDITDAANVELGVSGASQQPREQSHRQLLGADLTFRFRRPEEAQYRGLIWRNEILWSRRRLAAEFDPVSGAYLADPVRLNRRGVYSMVEYQVDRRWSVGLRGDYAEEPDTRGTKSPTRAVAPWIMFAPSEFQRLTLQYQALGRPNGKTDHFAFLKWTAVLGPHGAHPF